MNTATLAWLVVLLLSAGTGGTPLSEEEEEKDDPSVRDMECIRVLMDLMQSECLYRTANYSGTQSFHFYLATSLNTKLVKLLYYTSIRKLLQHHSYEAVASYVWDIHQKDGVATFALMADMQTVVFSHFMLVANFDDSYRKYRIDLAYYLYRISNSELFVHLQPAVKDELEKIIKLLPEELRLVFFSPQFCLKNRRLNEYLSLLFVEDGRRQIITAPFRNNSLSAPFIWRKNVTDALGGGVAIKGRANFAVSLNWQVNGNYIYLDRTKANGVFGWANGQPVDGSLWRVHYVSSTIMFEQQGMYLCATDELDHVELEGYLVAGIGRDSPFMIKWKCRWAVERCEERGE